MKNREELLEAIDHCNFRLRQLKQEKGNRKLISNLRYKRNLNIKYLVASLAPDIDFASIMNEVKEK